MVVCVCRNIKDTDFEKDEELHERIMEDDVCCGTCCDYLECCSKSSDNDIR